MTESTMYPTSKCAICEQESPIYRTGHLHCGSKLCLNHYYEVTNNGENPLITLQEYYDKEDKERIKQKKSQYITMLRKHCEYFGMDKQGEVINTEMIMSKQIIGKKRIELNPYEEIKVLEHVKNYHWGNIFPEKLTTSKLVDIQSTDSLQMKSYGEELKEMMELDQ